MFNAIGDWWNTHKGEVGKCVIIALGALVWYVGRELMYHQRLPFVSESLPVPGSQDSTDSTTEG